MTQESIDISLKSFEAKDMAQALALGRTYFSPEHPCLDARYLEWLYLRNPAGAALMAVATVGEKWVGMMALVPVWLRCGVASQLVRYAVNVVVDPAYRGRNIFIHLIKATREHMAEAGEWLMGHPNAVALPGWKRQKMAFCPPLRPHAVLPRLAVGSDRWEQVAVGQLGELAALCRHNLGSTWRIDPDPDYLRWRYFDPPHRQYVVRVLARKKAWTPHMLVDRSFRFGVRLIVDWTTPEAVQSITGYLPRLVMLPKPVSEGMTTRRLMPLNEQRSMPFFVSTWGAAAGAVGAGFDRITLGASDF